MNTVVLEAEVFQQGNELPLCTINCGSFSVVADEQFELIDCIKWPLGSFPESLEQLYQQIFKPNQYAKLYPFGSLQLLFDRFSISSLKELDHNERLLKIRQLTKNADNDTPFYPPAFHTKYPYYYAVFYYRPAFGCEHLETGVDFCPFCQKTEYQLCLRCGALVTAELCTKCYMYLGKRCSDCGAYHISPNCCCQSISTCSECNLSIQKNYLCVNKRCGCLTHWWCYQKSLEQSQFSCGHCGNLQIEDGELAYAYILRLFSFLQNNKSALSGGKMKLFAYKCRKCQHVNVDTEIWLCHECGNCDLYYVEPVPLELADAETIFREGFAVNNGGAIQELCNFICKYHIENLYDYFLQGEEIEEDVYESSNE